MSSRSSQPQLLRALFTPPVLEDPEAARRMKTLATVLIAAVTIAIVLAASAPFVNADPLPALGVYVILLVIILVAFRLLQRGHVAVASHLLVWAMLVTAAGDAFVSGGIRGPTVPFLFVVVVLAGVTLGARALIGCTMLAGTFGIVLAVLETRGVLQLQSIAPLRMAMATTGGFAAVAVLVRLALLSEVERRQATEQLRQVVQTAMDGFLLVANDGRILDANPAFCRMFGAPAETLRSRTVMQIDAHMTEAQVVQQIETVLREGADRFETKLQRDDGSVVYAELSAVTMSVGKDAPSVAAFVRDVTDRRQAQRALQESEARYRGLFENSRDAIYVTTIDGAFEDVNPSMCNLFGYARNELLLVNARELYADSVDRERFQELVGRYGSLSDFPVMLKKKTGEEIECLLTASARRDEESKIVAYEGIVRDVTAQKQKDRALRESERRLAEAEHLAVLGTWEWDMVDGTVVWSNELYRVLGEIPGKERPTFDRYLDHVHSDDRAEVDRTIRHAVETGESFEIVHRAGYPDGTQRTLEARGRVFRDESGESVRMVVSAQDITEMKHAEQALRESEERYRVLFENAPIGIGLADRDGNLLAYNDAMLEPGGYERGDPCLTNVAQFYLTQDDRARALHELQERGSVRQMETRFRRSDTGSYDALLSLSPVTVEDKDRVLAIVQDVTERKKAERALADSRQMLQLVLDAIPTRVFWADRNSVYLGCNRIFAEDAGVARAQDIIGKNDFELSWAGRAEQYRRDDQDVMGSGRPKIGYEEQVLRADGRDRWVRASKVPLRNMEGSVIGVLGTFEDITERREAEHAVQVSEARFAKAFGLSPDAIVISKVSDQRMIDVNDSFVRMTGYERSEAVGRTAHDLGLWGEDPGARDQFVSRLRSEQGARDVEVTFFDSRREPFVCLLSGEVIDLDGEPHVFFYAKDITDRKRNEERTRQSREQLRSLAARLQSVREEERTMMAREIHDQLGQALTGVKMDLSWMVNQLPPDAGTLRERGRSVMALVDTTIDTVRDLSTRLRPSVLDDLGLAAAVEWQVGETAQRAGLDYSVEAPADTRKLDRERATALFRILQEALTNVARHADAIRVDVNLRDDGNDLVLEIADDGKGVEIAKLDNVHSMGILGMRERAAAFDGEVDVRRRARGTVVTARMPRAGRATHA